MAFELKLLNPGDVALLRRVYKKLTQVFSPEELDSEEEMVASLQGKHSNCRLMCVVAFHPSGSAAELEERSKRLGGICCWEYFVRSQCYLFTYLWIDELLNGRGLGVQISLKCWEIATSYRE